MSKTKTYDPLEHLNKEMERMNREMKALNSPIRYKVELEPDSEPPCYHIKSYVAFDVPAVKPEE